MSMGALALLVCGIINVQPMCTERDFQMALGTSIQGDHEFVARAVFDDYVERAQEIQTVVDDQNMSTIEKLDIRLQQTIQADNLFDEFLDSLSVLNNEEIWKMGIVNLRRSVFLEARKQNNPWPSTVWVNLPNVASVPKSVLLRIDAFLIENIDHDIQDRFGAARAKLSGTHDDCRLFEKQAMERWGDYTDIVEPHIEENIKSILYPQLTQDSTVERIISWIVNNIDDPTIKDKANLQLAVWKTTHTKQQQEVISLIRSARINFGFDPWSRGCGDQSFSRQSRIKNKLLQKTAEIQESTETTCKTVLQLLSPEQRQRFKDDT